MGSWSEDDLRAIAENNDLRWSRAAMSHKAGRVSVADKHYEVTFESAGDESSDAIDGAYETAYPGSSAVPVMQGDGPKSATVRILLAA